ncbi:DUF4115 domain-containing protein [Nonomuraea dietziae]|uniref:DUF4115 domain-containing protein n=1 Tax=Nonomuraea dietziae TaxID=65515 RepID=UPI0031D55A9E
MKVKANRSSYINVRDSEGKRLFAGTLRAGSSDTWTAKTGLNLVLRDAGGGLAAGQRKEPGHTGSQRRVGQALLRSGDASSEVTSAGEVRR